MSLQGRPRVLIVCQPSLARARIAATLRSGRLASVVASTGDSELAQQYAQQLRPDIALVSNRMICISGESLIRGLHRAHPEVRLVAIVPALRLTEVAEALQAGAVGVVDEHDGADALGDAIRAASSARGLLTGPSAAVLLDGLEPHGGMRLTPRQQQVLGLLAGQMGTAEIASRLGIRPATVRRHVRRILQFLGADSPAHAVSLACRLGLVRLD